ncbi:MAG: MauE/DoxX family redox-associated membrane protein [Solirubrobacterales bacterium]
MSVALLVVRLGLAAIFAVAAVTKLADRAGTQRTLADFGVPAGLVPAGALALPAAELAAAALLVPTPTARWGALLALVLLLLFAIGIVRVLARGERPECNCFGGVHSAPVGPGTLIRNLAFAVGAALVLAAGAGKSLAAVDGAVVLTVAAGAAGLLLLGLTWFCWELFKQNGRLLSRVAVLEEAVGVGAELPPLAEFELGDPAPDLVFATPAGEPVMVSQLLRPDRPVALVFTDPACGGCQALTDRLPELRAEVGDAIEPVLLHARREALIAFGVGAIPAAVAVDSEGRMASAAAIGERAVVELLRSFAGAPELELIEMAGVPAGARR